MLEANVEERSRPAGASVWRRYGPAMLIVMNIVWGISYAAADVGLRHMGVGGLAAWRFLLASILLFPMMRLVKAPMGIRLADLPKVMAIGIISVAGTYLLTYRGIQLASATDRAMVSPLEPVALAVLSFFLLKERLRRSQWLGIAIACCGAYLLATRDLLTGGAWSSRHALGDALILLSFLTEGMYSIIGKPLLERYRPITLTAWSMGFAAIFLFVVMAVRGGLPPPPPNGQAWAAVLFLAIPCTVIGYTLWYAVLEHLPVGVVGSSVFIQPVVGLVIGVALYQERLSLPLLGGAALVMAGVYLTGNTQASDPIPDPEPSA